MWEAIFPQWGPSSDGNVSNGEWDEASLACLLLTCCAAHFLTGRGTRTGPWPGGWGPLLQGVVQRMETVLAEGKGNLSGHLYNEGQGLNLFSFWSNQG